jgi:hypothetical protein
MRYNVAETSQMKVLSKRSARYFSTPEEFYSSDDEFLASQETTDPKVVNRRKLPPLLPVPTLCLGDNNWNFLE